jgi:hypothetical protein
MVVVKDLGHNKRERKEHDVRVSGFWSLAGLVVVGIIIADALVHYNGTAAAAKGAADIITPSEGALLGKAP